MTILCWNARGLGDPRDVHRLRMISRDFSPEILFLSETKLFGHKAAMLRIQLGFNNSFAADSIGRSGCLALLWNDN